MASTFHTTRAVGKYLVTPLTTMTDAGDYAASVSIRRGMYDRIFRFIPRFDSAESALHYALAQSHGLLQPQTA